MTSLCLKQKCFKAKNKKYIIKTKSTWTNQTLTKQNKHLIFRAIQYKSKKDLDN